ncbi:MAG: hypothetical protein E7Y34_03185, partial [Mycoplasma sp.]|nr:hypothetical protein [Mycoplasma sp.]
MLWNPWLVRYWCGFPSHKIIFRLYQNKFLRVAKGLGQNVNGLDVKPTDFSKPQPMIVTQIAPISI